MALDFFDSMPLRIRNRNDRDLNTWTKVFDSQSFGEMALSQKLDWSPFVLESGSGRFCCAKMILLIFDGMYCVEDALADFHDVQHTITKLTKSKSSKSFLVILPLKSPIRELHQYDSVVKMIARKYGATSASWDVNQFHGNIESAISENYKARRDALSLISGLDQKPKRTRRAKLKDSDATGV